MCEKEDFLDCENTMFVNLPLPCALDYSSLLVCTVMLVAGVMYTIASVVNNLPHLSQISTGGTVGSRP